MGSRVVNLHTGASADVAIATGTILSAPDVVTIGIVDITSERVFDQIADLKSIYPDPSPELANAMRAVAESIDFCINAIDTERAGDRMGADEFMLHAQALLPDLVRVKHLSDGFGILVAAHVFLFANKAGAPFSSDQMLALLKSYRAMWNSPYLTEESAVTITDDLEAVNLDVDPSPLTQLFNEAEEAGLVDR